MISKKANFSLANENKKGTVWPKKYCNHSFCFLKKATKPQLFFKYSILLFGFQNKNHPIFKCTYAMLNNTSGIFPKKQKKEKYKPSSKPKIQF